MKFLRNLYDWIASLLSSHLRIKRVSNEEAKKTLEKHPINISHYYHNIGRNILLVFLKHLKD